MRDAPKVLIIEDELAIREVLADNLAEEGYVVEAAADGAAGLAAWRTGRPDLVVLDVMLPHLDGFEVCRRMREDGDMAPVLFLSARGQPADRVQGLKVGGDDYLVKPFHLPEFLLRVRAMLRRGGWRPEERSSYAFGGHTVDYRAWTARLADGRTEPLGERELKIFRVLAGRSGQVVSREEILDGAWGDDAFPSSRTVDNFVMRLRRLFEPDPSNPRFFHTVWGVGYRFTPDARTQDAHTRDGRVQDGSPPGSD